MKQYRMQFCYPPAPRGFRDEDFFYYFDGNNTLALAQPIPALDAIRNIALPLHRDAPFIWRGTKVFSDQPALGVEFRTPDGELMSDDVQPLYQSFWPGGFLIAGTVPVTMEPGIECPLGAVIQLDLANLSGTPIIDPTTAVLLMGVKRWRVQA
jgi:hypothetical protein